ncbi:MAG TPA: SMP-30/gluconolactonase/LRE family protein [Gammaproteobacteria bacterium]|nr:SMP-30/gluconolactonase/LRE family protein [Gammaproteobacteria bacterium]
MADRHRVVEQILRQAVLWGVLLVSLSAIGLTYGAAKLSDEIGPSPELAAPLTSDSAVNFSTVVGWPEGQTPTAPEGFVVQKFADGLISPRWAYVLPNGDVLVAEASTLPDRDTSEETLQGLRQAGNVMKNANRITLLRDTDDDDKSDVRRVFLDNLNQPFGMAMVGDNLYVANTDALLKFPYTLGETRIDAHGKKITDLPAGGYNNHWTRNVVPSRDRQKLYVSVGSATNVDEEHIDVKDVRRAAILEINPDGTELRVFADGLRNPNGMDWAPGTEALWTVVNERDELGDELVPDYLTHVREGAFYGWPYSYFGLHVDPRHKGDRPDLVKRAVKPDYALGAHTASLGLQFYTGKTFPKRYWGNAFVAQHGSWNRSQLVGYKVLTVAFKNGQPAGPAEEFLTGFIANQKKAEVYGRPVGLVVMRDGSLLVTDDAAGIVWRVSPEESTSEKNATIAGLRSPESALQMSDGRIYVSEIGQQNKAGDGGIAMITPDGELRQYVSGLDDPKGLARWDDSLYVADVKGVYRIDRFAHPILMAAIKNFPTTPKLLNDLTVTKDGTLYVSDTGDLEKGGGAVYRIDQSGAVERVLGGEGAPLQNPNGLLIQKNHLLVADFGRGELQDVDLTSLKTKQVANGLGAADGIAITKDGQLYVSDWQSGEVFRIRRNGNAERLGVADRFGAAADIRLTQDGNYLMVPDMKKGTLTFIPL